MDQQLKEKLNALGPLTRASVEVRTCKVCGGRAPLFDVVDFNKICAANHYLYGRSGIDVSYFRCVCCDFLFTDLIDNWSHEEISAFIYNDDYVKIDPEYVGARPKRTAAMMAKLLSGCKSLRILDYGSGSGVFARHMAELGFPNVVGYDPFSHPLPPDGLFDLVTAFEVVEHSPNPVETFGEMAKFVTETGALVVGQSIQPANLRELKCNWWYTAPRNGHVSTYSLFTLALIAKNLGLRLRSKTQGGGPFGFARPALRPDLAAVMDRLGPTYSIRVLRAPHQSREPLKWHGVEKNSSAVQFRWTGSDRLTWDCDLIPGRNRIEVPFLMEVHVGYARRCRLAAQGAELPTSIANGRLVAELDVVDASSAAPVELRMPAPVSPEALGRSMDRRKLGLAVPVDDPAMPL